MDALQRFVIPNARPTGVPLGKGSYGSVEEVEANGIICAGKIIYEILIERENVGAEGIARKYVEECQLMSDLRHPHLVQFLGVCFLPNSTLPVLVMERLLTSLDELLEHNPDIPLSLKRSILADVARGLVYLHSRSPPVIHRDLSAKNVLLNSAMVAKISDLGNARIANFQSGQLARSLTRIPGTMVYMPPEAFDMKADYGPRLDSFSFGHLALFTITQVFPVNLLTHTYPDPRNPDHLLARTEVQRRAEYIQLLHRQLGDQHPLVGQIKRCLHNIPSQRPSAQELLQQLEDMQARIEDPHEHLTKLEAMKLLRDKYEEVQQLQLQVQASTEEIISLQDQVKQLQLEQYYTETEKALARKDAEISRLMDDIGNVQEQNSHVVAMLESDLEAKEAEINRLMGELQHFQSQIILYPGAPVKWTQCANLPIDGTHSSQAVVVKSKVYVGGGETAMFSSFSLIYVYDFFGDSWKAIQGPTMFSALAAYEERLVLVGGKDATTFKASNQLWVLEEDEQTWTQPLPAMTTPTVWASVASFDNHLIVAGSQEDKMEIFDGKQWTVTSSLPEACHGVVSSTVHKGHFYLMHYNRRVVFYASLESLIKQVKNGKRQSLWNTLQSAPYIGCSIGSFGGSLVAVGGSGKNDSFHMYDPLNQSWVLVGKMSIGTRYSCTTTLPNGDLLVVMGDDATVKGATWSPLVYKASLQSH